MEALLWLLFGIFLGFVGRYFWAAYQRKKDMDRLKKELREPLDRIEEGTRIIETRNGQ